MTLKQLINASGGPSRCAQIWGMTMQSVSRIIKRNSISRELLIELIDYHRHEQLNLFEVIFGNKKVDFEIIDRKSNRSKK